MSQLENQDPADREFVLRGLRRLQGHLTELSGKLLVHQKEEKIAAVTELYETLGSYIYHETNQLFKPSLLYDVIFQLALQEVEDNLKKAEKGSGILRSDGFNLFVFVVRHIADENRVSVVEAHDLPVLQSLFTLLESGYVRQQSHHESEVCDLLCRLVTASGISCYDTDQVKQMWSTCWSLFKSSAVTTTAVAVPCLRVLSTILRGLDNTVFSLDTKTVVQDSSTAVFSVVKKKEFRSWTSSFTNAILDFVCVLIDGWGLEYRESLMEDLLFLAELFLGQLSVHLPDKGFEVDYVWLFFDRLTSLAMPDCYSSSLTAERIFDIAPTCTQSLISDLVKKSLNRDNFVVPPSKVPLFARFLVISELSGFLPTNQFERSPKRKKEASPLEMFCDFDFDSSGRPRNSSRPLLLCSFISILKEVVVSWHHRLGSHRLANIGERVFSLNRKLVESQFTPFCQFFTELIRSGAMGDSVKVKSEAAAAEPMQNPMVRVKALWKFAISAANNSPLAAEAAMELMVELILHFREVLAGGYDHEKLVDSVSMVLPANLNTSTFKLLSALLCELEFDEKKPFAGAENREAGMEAWRFRYQVAEWLLTKATQSPVLQLFQLCCYHPEAFGPIIETREKTGIERDIVLLGLSSVRPPAPPALFPSLLGCCLIPEVLESVVNILNDCWLQDEVKTGRRFFLFTTIVGFADCVYTAAAVTEDNSVTWVLDSLLLSVNEWLAENAYSFQAEDLPLIDPGPSSRCISAVAKAAVLSRAGECPLLFARFPSEEPIPPKIFVAYVEESARLIRKYEDLKVSVETAVKVERESHRVELNKTVSFKSFLGNQIVTFAETRIDYLPDLLLLFEKAGDICSEKHIAKLARKAVAIISEDAGDQSQEETQLARISVAKAVVNAYRVSGRLFAETSIISLLPVTDCARYAECLVFDANRVLNLTANPILMQRIVGRVLSTSELWPAHVDLLSIVIQNNSLYQLCEDYVKDFALHVEFNQISLALRKQQSAICDAVLKRKIEALRSQDIVKLLSKSEVLPFSAFPSVLLASHKNWPVVTKSFWLNFEANSNSLLALLKGQVTKHIALGLQERFVTFLGALCNGMPRMSDQLATPFAWILHSSLVEILASLPPLKSDSSTVEAILSVLEGLGAIEDHGLSLSLVEKLPASVKDHPMIPEDLEEECAQCVQKFIETGSVENLSFMCTSSLWDQLARVLNSEDVDNSATFGPFLFDRLLLFWELLPSFRPQMTRVLHHFEESRSSRAARTQFSAEGSFDLMVTLLREFCTITVLRSTDVAVVEAALNILSCSAINTENAPSTAKLFPEIPRAKAPGELALAVRLLNGLLGKNEDLTRKQLFSVIGTSLRVMPLLSHLISPFLCSLDPDASTPLLQFVKDHSSFMNPLNERRLIRTLCECVDGVGLGALAMTECDGKEFLTLGRLAVTAGFNQHACAMANLAFDLILGASRKMAVVGDAIPQNELLDQLLCDVYLATENSQALDSLPAYTQLDPRVQLLRATVTYKWLQVASSPVSTVEQKAAARWYCGIGGAGTRESRFFDALVSGKFDEDYPKRLRTHPERLFVLIRNQSANSDVFEKEILNKYVSEITTMDFICPQACKYLSEISVLNRKQSSSDFLQSLPVHSLCLLMWKIRRRCLPIAQNPPTQSEYRECFEFGILLLLDKLLKQKAFPAALAVIEESKQLAVDHSFAQRLVLKECEIHIEMGDHQLAEHKLYDIANFINLSVASPDDSAVASEDQEIGIDVVCLLSKIKADYSPKDVELAIKTMKLLESCGAESTKSREICFDLGVRQLFELEAYVETPLIKLRKEARDRHKDEMKALRQARFVSTSDQKRANLLNKEHACEEKELSDLDEKLKNSVLFTIRTGFELLNSLCLPLKSSDPLPEGLKEEVVRVLFPLIDVIFRYEKISEVTTLLKNQMSNSFIPSVWLPSVPHIMPHCFRKGELSFVIQDLILKMIIAYPYHVLMTVLSYKYDAIKGDTDKLSSKARMVDDLLSRAKRSSRDPGLTKAVEDMAAAHEVYRAFVWKPIKNTELHPDFQEITAKGVVRYKISKRSELFTKIDVLKRVPLPTATQTVGQAGDYSRNGLILWSEVHTVCDKADGNSSPKILKVRGSNGIVYKMVWKDGESVRQDCLVQDLFSVMGGLLEHPLRTYNVVPLDTLSGIIEFCDGTQSLKDLLIGATSRAGLHHDIHPNEDVYTVRRQMASLQEGGRRLLTEEQFRDALKQVTPVFRHHFYRNFSKVYEWSAMLQNYTKSLAQWSIVCYVVGLGDRHGSNVLFEPQTSRFVHIDLGMILEFSKRILPIPELVPFRLTRDLMDPILIQGIRGNLAYEAADAMHKMRKHKEVILGVASVFLRETVSNFRDTSEDSQRSFASATAIGRLQAKLNGTDATISPVPPFDQALRLLAEATNLDKLSKLFHGWLAIL